MRDGSYVRPRGRDSSLRTYNMEREMYREGRLEYKYGQPRVMGREEVKKRLMEDLNIGD